MSVPLYPVVICEVNQMAFNPSPKVAAARDFARKFGKEQVVILSINKTGELEYASYGETKSLCSEAKKLGNIAFDSIMDSFR